MEDEMSRIEKFNRADAACKKNGIAFSPTGIYRVEDSEGIEVPMNVCGICLVLEDDPDNYGDTIAPTTYDGDCDECHGDSRFYCHEDDKFDGEPHALDLLI